MNKLPLVKKIFFMKEIFFSFTKYLFFSSRKTIFFLISKNLAASVFLLPSQILQNGDMPQHLPTTEANFARCRINKNYALLCPNLKS